MAQRGRKPIPTAIKELEGNPGKRELNQNEPKPKKNAPKCPIWLDVEAKKEWRRVSKQLEEIGVLTEVDMAAFAGYWQQVPHVSIAQTYLKIMIKFCKQFGMTPSSRSRIVAEKNGSDTDDPMELLLGMGGKQ